MNHMTDLWNIGTTFQMSLDAFLEDTHPSKHANQKAYAKALRILEQTNHCRSPFTKQKIANEALSLCADCIEAYLILGINEADMYKKLDILKTGVELATMNLGKDFFLRDASDFYLFDEAKPLFHIKFAYARTLYEAGYMRKAQRQFQEIRNLNPPDVFQAHHYLLSISLYLEELELCKEILDSRKDDTFTCLARFLYYLKKEDYASAAHMVPNLKKRNPHLFQMLTYEKMNILGFDSQQTQGSKEEADYVYRIISKVVQPMEYVHIFLTHHAEQESA